MRRRLLSVSSLLSFLLQWLSSFVMIRSSFSLPQCQFPNESVFAHYHGDKTCDRVDQNSPQYHNDVLARNEELHRQPTGIQHVPNEKTVTCPLPSATTSLYPHKGDSGASNNHLHHLHLGTYTTWIVENTSQLPVVVAFVEFETGREVSAFNAHIAPPHADPLAILMPHQWKALRTMEGHVFHIYELLGQAGDYQLGRLVLQHRVGLVPIYNKYAENGAATTCGNVAPEADQPPLAGNNDVASNENVDMDEYAAPYEQVGDESAISNEPVALRRLTEVAPDLPVQEMAEVPSHWNGNEMMVEVPPSVMAAPAMTTVLPDSTVDQVVVEVHPDFQRAPSVKFENCNVLYRGFRNMAGCPLHAYYTGISPPPLTTGGAMQCEEDFKFHLGINGQAADYENDWDSTTKFETTFIGHTYTFRLASHPNVLVDAYTFVPTRVVDCPETESSTVPHPQHDVGEAVAESVHMPLGDAVTKSTTVPVVVDGVTVGIEGVVLVYAIPNNTNKDGDARRRLVPSLNHDAHNKSWSQQGGHVYVTAAASAIISRGIQ